MNEQITDKIVVGSEEWCALPEMGIPAIRARIDSGAKTSSLHAVNINPLIRNGENWVSFEVHPVQRNRKIVIRHEAKVFDLREIKNTGGVPEKRYVIKQILKLGDHSFEIEVTLANRDAMGYRMLLGREAMIDRILIDPAGSMHIDDYSPEQIDRLYSAYRKERSGLRIAVLASNQNLYSNQRLIEAGEERGHRIRFLNIRNCYMKLDSKNPGIYHRGGRSLNNFDAVIPRIRPSMTFYGCAISRLYESIGITVLNRAGAIARSRDKLHSSQLFIKSGLNMPVTGFANSPQDTEKLIEMVGGAPLIVKLLKGTQGHGVVLAETQKASESVINALKSLHANVLVQEFVRDASSKDIRCLVIGHKVVASIERDPKPGDFRANLHRGGRIKVARITSEERRMAIKASKVLGLDVCGVDILRTERGPMLIEVNSSPGLEGVESATGKDIASLMIIEIERRLGWKRELAT